jgi:hypothetical protein
VPSDDVPEGYKLVKPIGSGGSSRVYLAQQLSIGRNVALKLFSQDLGDESQRADFTRECDAARQLGTSPFVVSVFEAGIAGRRPWLAMEYYPRGSLADLLRRDRKVDPQVALTLAVKLADALCTLHRADLFHGDIKPGNVLLSHDGAPVLTDFGLSVTRQAQSSMTLDAFSPPYAAPERLSANRYSAASEVWGLGAVFYELLTGQPPFMLRGGEGIVSFATRVANDALDPDVLATLPGPLRDVLTTALAKDRGDRPSIERLAADMRSAQTDLGWLPVPPPTVDFAATTHSAATILRRRAPVPKPGTRRAARWPMLLPITAVAAAIAVLVTGVVVFGARPATRAASRSGGQTETPSSAGSSHAGFGSPSAAPVSTTPVLGPSSTPLAPNTQVNPMYPVYPAAPTAAGGRPADPGNAGAPPNQTTQAAPAPVSTGAFASPTDGAQVPQCAYFSGTSTLAPGMTLILVMGNLDNGDPNRYVQFVFGWKQPSNLRSWRGAQYFGHDNDSVGQHYRVDLMAVSLATAQNASATGSSGTVNALAGQGTTLASLSVRRISGLVPDECPGP